MSNITEKNEEKIFLMFSEKATKEFGYKIAILKDGSEVPFILKLTESNKDLFKWDDAIVKKVLNKSDMLAIDNSFEKVQNENISTTSLTNFYNLTPYGTKDYISTDKIKELRDSFKSLSDKVNEKEIIMDDKEYIFVFSQEAATRYGYLVASLKNNTKVMYTQMSTDVNWKDGYLWKDAKVVGKAKTSDIVNTDTRFNKSGDLYDFKKSDTKDSLFPIKFNNEFYSPDRYNYKDGTLPPDFKLPSDFLEKIGKLREQIFDENKNKNKKR